MSVNIHIANNRKIVRAIEQKEGKSFSEIVDIINAQNENRIKQKKAIKSTINPRLTKRDRCPCGSTFKRFFINRRFVTKCLKTNRSPWSCGF